MEELKITKKTEPVMFTIRVDKSIVDLIKNFDKHDKNKKSEEQDN